MNGRASIRVLLIVALTAAAAGMAARRYSAASSINVVGVQRPAGDEPLELGPVAPALFTRDSWEARTVAGALASPQISPAVAAEGPVLCHLLLAYGWGAIPFPRLSSGREVVDVLTDEPLAESRFGQSLLVPTRYGVRYRLIVPSGPPGQQGESHRDLCLATFAEAGMSLSAPVRTGQGNYAVRDLLADSMDCFDIHETEIAWTATAYALYLPPRRQWSNRDGQTFTMDELASELMDRPLGQASCGGAHLLMAMTLLLRADAQTPILSEPVRAALRQRLAESAAAAVAAQGRDGAWTIGWESASLVRPIVYNTPLFKLLVTGHLLQWMEYLPPELRPAQKTYRGAADWLCGELSRPLVGPPPPQEVCPWTHAVCAVKNLMM